MVKRFSMIIFAIVLTLYFGVPVIAQDAQKKEVHKHKMETHKTEMKEAGTVKQVACDPSCGFSIQSRDEKEIVSATKNHLKVHHGVKASDKEIKAKMKEVMSK